MLRYVGRNDDSKIQLYSYRWIHHLSLEWKTTLRTGETEGEREKEGEEFATPSSCRFSLVFMPDATIVVALKLILTWMTMRSLDIQEPETRKHRSTAYSYSSPPGVSLGRSWSLNRYTERIDVHARVIRHGAVLPKLLQSVHRGAI